MHSEEIHPLKHLYKNESNLMKDKENKATWPKGKQTPNDANADNTHPDITV